MAIAKKNPPAVKEPEISRAISEIYDDINDIISSVNSNIISVKDTVGGKTGDIRVTKVSEDKYRFEAKAEEGWIRPGGTDEDIGGNLGDASGGTDIGGSAAISDANTRNAVASIIARINKINEQLNNITFRLVKKGE